MHSKPEFEKWCLDHGALKETENNKWLIFRVRTNLGTKKAYRNKRGEETWSQFKGLLNLYKQGVDVDLSPYPEN